MADSSRQLKLKVILAIAGLIVLLAATWVWTAPARRTMRVFTLLLNAANREAVEEVRQLCSERWLATHSLEVAPEGGLKNFPRNIHKNFQVWSEGDVVLVRPTNRGRLEPVYRFVHERGDWKFDGLAGLMTADGQLVSPDSTDDHDLGHPSASGSN
ncbi:hypothetical protein Isop_0226 [Isosphaera pallida ATCC 43644]|jgi:hypothetical protein|uniref:Uncharacterized protein n=1 Tax=Isosphaera pallida (strain ATCC 43644 / DSM 9630 / IS1B) TaxID=575540 RepID=E8QWD6_ISOPI|nr:hypothetical protein [Isosphaera pallida]ADV60823.1 hypothetical protein Isop_0226 [Isosphaera pallida ATCC 43644]